MPNARVGVLPVPQPHHHNDNAQQRPKKQGITMEVSRRIHCQFIGAVHQHGVDVRNVSLGSRGCVLHAISTEAFYLYILFSHLESDNDWLRFFIQLVESPLRSIIFTYEDTRFLLRDCAAVCVDKTYAPGQAFPGVLRFCERSNNDGVYFIDTPSHMTNFCATLSRP
jgi:hypothetical protein